ncbi:hypothetical protein DdX_15540 [Ditylenchus destructor]|uniref:Uncharacterized protein n=1 Tax=Ditylenchus destructor TaxID=166010 RepID=A0AAD4MRA6_9BILA|nr:hypothetical protein DdX_15540 [Ditylenchus destructor]
MNYDLDDRQYRCCCNSMHIQSVAHLVAIVGLHLSVFGMIFSAVMWRWDFAIIFCLNLLLSQHMTIIYGIKRQNPSLLRLFLILNGGCIALLTVFILISGLMLKMIVTSPEKWLPKNKDLDDATKTKTIQDARHNINSFIAFLSVYQILDVWFQYIIFRAYKYMKMAQLSLLICNQHIQKDGVPEI